MTWRALFISSYHLLQHANRARVASREVVDDGHRVPVFQESHGCMGADETGAACDEHVAREGFAVVRAWQILLTKSQDAI